MQSRLAVLVFVLVAGGCGDDTSRTPTSPSAPAPDPAALAVTCPTGVVASTTSTTTAVSYPTPTTTGGRPPVTVTCSPFSGASFPIGTTTVACQAVDSRNTAAACTFSVLVSRIPVLTRTRFLAFGDSTTAGEVTVSSPTTFGLPMPWSPLVLMPAVSYPTQLHGFLTARYVSQVSAIEVVNSGRSGESASEGAQRFPSVMASTRPEVVLLLQGYNDLNLLGSRGIATGIAGLDSMAKEARNRGARVFIASLTPSRPGGRNSMDPELLVEFNSRMRTLAAGEGAVFVNLYDAMLPSLSTLIGTDGLHPTEAGYRRMAEEFLNAIRATLEAP